MKLTWWLIFQWQHPLAAVGTIHGLRCHLGTPPCVILLGWPLGLHAWRSGWSQWKSLISDKSRMSLDGIYLSSGSYPSQFTRHCIWLTLLQVSRIFQTIQAGDPSISRGHGGINSAVSVLDAVWTCFDRDSWKKWKKRSLAGNFAGHRIYLPCKVLHILVGSYWSWVET